MTLIAILVLAGSGWLVPQSGLLVSCLWVTVSSFLLGGPAPAMSHKPVVASGAHSRD